MKAITNKIAKRIALVLCLLAHLSVFAIQEEVEVSNTGLGITSIINIQSSRKTLIDADMTGWYNDFRFSSISNEIIFGIDQDIHRIDDAYRYMVKFDVSGTTVDGTTLSPYSEVGVELELDYSPIGTYQDKEVYSFEGAVNMTIDNIQFYKWDDVGGAYVLMAVDRDNLFLKAKIETEYYNDFDYTIIPTTVGVSLTPFGTDMLVSFPAVDGAEKYDLEWAWVNGYKGTVDGGVPEIYLPGEVEYNFKTNASRVRVDNNSYSIPLVYGDGYLVIRYRAVGRMVTNLDVDIDGPWMTDSYVDGEATTVVSLPLNCWKRVYAIEDHSLNYGASMTFIENGRRNTSINFADGMMKSRQQISQINSQDELLVGSVIYDYYGRPAIGVMGSPVNESDLGYIENLNMKDGSTPYDKAVFHQDAYMLGTCGPQAAPPMDPDASLGSAHYYSASNSNKDGAEAFVPEANGYNFTQVHYANDPTGRAKRVGSVGIDHQLDETTDHYTQVMTSQQVDNMELDRYFGSEAAHFSNYSRVVSRDVHGQISVSIQDNFGRTVMTYLSGSAPDELEAIDGNSPEEPTDIEVDLTEFTSSGDDLDAAGILLVDHKIVVEDASEIYTFNYDFTALSFTDCLPLDICFDCIYEIEFEVVPAEGDFTAGCPLTDGTSEISSTWSYTVGSITEFNIDCETPLVFSDLHDETFTLQFPRNEEYYVRKTLKVSEAPIEYYWDQYIENADAECLTPFSAFLADAMLDIDYSDCYGGSPCALNFLYEYGTFDEWEIITGGTETEYDDLREEYIEGCLNEPICSQMRPILLGDVSPGGQYGDVSGGSGLSVFNAADPMEYSWRDVTFLNDDDTPAMTTNDADELVPVNDATISLTQFLTLWNPNWAELLLGAHPEYQTYLFCETYSEVFEYATDFNSTETYADAVASGFITPVNPILYPAGFGGSPEPFTSGDPLIDLILDTGVDGLKNDLDDVLSKYQYDDSYEGGTNSYFDAIEDLLELTGGSTLYEAASAMTDGSTFGTSTCDLDAQWEAFRTLYIARRNIILQIAMEGRAIRSGSPEAACIEFASLDCASYSDYEFKTKRFMLYDHAMPYSFLEMMSDPMILEDMEDDAEAGTLDFCETACESMADGWMYELESCATELLVGTWAEGNATYDAIRADLITVCKGGCSTEWPFPSQYDEGGVGYLTSFESVIEHYLALEGIPAETMDCNHYLIDSPSPDATLSLVDSLTTCGCDMLLSVDSEEAFEEMYGFIPENFCGERESCADVQGVSSGATYVNGSLTWSPMQIAELYTYYTVNNYGCENDDCIECLELDAAIMGFMSEYPAASIEEDAVMFTSYVNEMYGTTFDYFTLITFKETCDSLAAGGDITEGLNPEAYDMINFMNGAILSGELLTGGLYPFDDFPSLVTPENIAAAGCTGTGDEFNYYGSVSGSQLIMSFDIPGGCVSLLCIQASFTATPIMTPELLAIYTGAPDVLSNLISFEEIYVTYDDIIATDNRFHATALVEDPAGGDPLLVEFQIVSGCLEVIGDLGTICENIVPVEEDDCVDDLIANAELTAEFEYGEYLETMKEQFIANYIETCRQVDETYNYSFQANRYHRTLFFYDVAGNLVKTVSPKGINPISNAAIADVKLDRAGAGGAVHIPVHDFTTNYVYNGLNQPISLTTPDGGTTNFWYDEIGRLVVSQNARQAALKSNEIAGDPLNPLYTSLPAYSYSLFDDLGRPIEFGEFVQPNPMTAAISKDPTDLSDWLFEETFGPNTRYRNNVTRIGYSTPTSPDAIAELGGDQGDIRNRVSSVSTVSGYVEMDAGWTFPMPDYLNHYAYDVHGNVGSFVQEIPDLTADGRQFFHTEYDYDLLSGLPHYVHFQRGEQDQYSHNFVYDADNRLKEVYTSKDGVIWDRDAEYTYRLDGKRARTELGDVQVQGMDYAYTIHGWLKGLNSGVLDPSKDMGKDGHNFGGGSSAGPNSNVAQDALAFTMGYFDGDYTRIDNTNPLTNFLPDVSGSAFEIDQISLFNGNISSVTTAMMDLDEIRLDVIGSTYRYDQLHRFKENHVFTSNDITELNSFVNAARQNLTAGTSNTLGDYEVHVDYDKNGNITELDRRAKDEGFGSNKMDEFTYNYPSTTNRLKDVQDAISGTSYGDIQSGQVSGNYEYHPDGSLKADEQEEIGYIEWYPNGKLKRIYRIATSVQPDLYFEYDPMGARSLKVEMTKDLSGNLLPEADWNYSWYTPDANGQTMAIYKKDAGSPVLHRAEAMIFGASRIGLDTRQVEIDVAEVFTLDDFTLGSPCITAGEWALSSGTTHSLSDFDADGSTDITFGHNVNYYASLNINTEPGETYTVSYDILDQTIGWVYGRAKTCPGAGTVLGLHNASSPGSYSYTFNATTSITKIMWFGQAVPGSGGSFTLGNLSITGEGDIFGDFDNEVLTTNEKPYRELGEKMYELGDHLGNVKEVITDRKLQIIGGGYSLDNFVTGSPCVDIAGWYMNQIPGTTYGLVDMNGDGESDLTVNHASATTFMAVQTVSTVVGETYTVSYEVYAKSVPSVLGRAKECLPGSATIGSHDATVTGSYSYTFVATSVKTKLFWYGAGSTGSFTLVDVIVSGPGDIYGLGSAGETILAYVPDVVSYSDYYPYGMEMPNRHGSLADYRYAFNGMEVDNEVSGDGNSYTTMFRQYDPRLGRWKSLDPLASKYPGASPFSAYNNNPIYFVDPLGLEGEVYYDYGGVDPDNEYGNMGDVRDKLDDKYKNNEKQTFYFSITDNQDQFRAVHDGEGKWRFQRKIGDEDSADDWEDTGDSHNSAAESNENNDTSETSYEKKIEIKDSEFDSANADPLDVDVYKLENYYYYFEDGYFWDNFGAVKFETTVVVRYDIIDGNRIPRIDISTDPTGTEYLTGAAHFRWANSNINDDGSGFYELEVTFAAWGSDTQVSAEFNGGITLSGKAAEGSLGGSYGESWTLNGASVARKVTYLISWDQDGNATVVVHPEIPPVTSGNEGDSNEYIFSE